MVARIRTGKSLKGAVNYNEAKVSEGKAELIGAIRYPKIVDQLSFHEKLNRLQNLANLNTRTKTNCLHLSLNFDPQEHLSRNKVIQIAEAYMQGIGFGGQPYLVYEHFDAAHQHIHIVSTNIQKDGHRISLHNLGSTISEKIRREIEANYNLVEASHRQQKQLQLLNPVNLEKALYGKVQTKRAITNVVNQALSQYRFTSLAQFNAVLQQYGVRADRGEEGSRMFEKGGLQYSMLDKNLQNIGVPIKASSIYGKPTLALLETKYEDNRKIKMAFKSQTKSAIHLALKTSRNKNAFTSSLRQKGVDVIWRSNGQNFIYGVTYIDHNTKSVFNGSELGKEFSAASLKSAWNSRELIEELTEPGKQVVPSHERSTVNLNEVVNDLLDLLTDPVQQFDYVPRSLKKKRRKKKSRRL